MKFDVSLAVKLQIHSLLSIQDSSVPKTQFANLSMCTDPHTRIQALEDFNFHLITPNNFC